MDAILSGLFLMVAVGATYRSVKLFSHGFREADHPSGSASIVRGLRAVIVALAMGALAGGLLLANSALLIFGAIFLGEELYETGIVLLALRKGRGSLDERSARSSTAGSLLKP